MGTFGIVFIILTEYCVVLFYVHKLDKNDQLVQSKDIFRKRHLCKLELYAKIGIAMLFILFNLIYWCYYTYQYLKEDHQWVDLE